MHHFFAYMFRMRHIRRWGLMRNALAENVQEHSHQVAMIAHAITTLHNMRFAQGDNGTPQADMRKVLELAIYHEAGEVITGDLVTPIKHNPKIKSAFKSLEKLATDRLLTMLPPDMAKAYDPILHPDEQSLEWRIVKAADKITAYLKCVEEQKAGNSEFDKAMLVISRDISGIELEAVAEFMKTFAPSFALTLDELNETGI